MSRSRKHHRSNRSQQNRRVARELTESPGEHEAFKRPSRPAMILVGITLWMLPAAVRPRYSEEFRAEVMGMRRWRQLMYALRLVTRSWELRRCLQDGPPAATARDW